MTQWTDLFLLMPLSADGLHGLLFVTFGLHLLFVLLMLGTALLGLLFFLHNRLGGDGPQLWNRHIVDSHLGLKSLAVVLGVAPLLIVQVRYSHAFFTATGLFSYAWLAVIPLLIAAFLLIDAFGHTMQARAWLAVFCGVLGVGALLTVPAIFTGALSLMERRGEWAAFADKDLGAGFAAHWLLRYLHVIGAAFVFGAAFHLFFSTADHPEKAVRLRNWLFGATLVQIVIGIPLVFSVAVGLDWPVIGAVTVGVAAAMLVLRVLRPAAPSSVAAGPRSLLILLPVLFVSMLVARQFLQDRSLAPIHEQAVAARQERAKELAPYREQALAAFTAKLNTVYDNGDTIYDGACQPCHGLGGRGNGPAAARLLIPAENLTAIRADRSVIYTTLKDGTPGSGMPYFRLYDREKLERVLDTLSERFSMFAATPKPQPVGPAAMQVWNGTCAVCHGTDGGVSAFGHTLLPAPPDLRVFSLTPEHALEVITNGYPGTAMQPYRDLPDTLRAELAAVSNTFRADR
uniref:cytochrome c n=1 Tax=uncultured Bilophila sp. TaxID=529385 RepID=UPI0025D54CB0|nr:c-type cytochrome [uncultured Bilophila sp.]